jgi:hypothetical protein
MAARSFTSVFQPIVAQAGVEGFNQLILPECRLPLTDPAACDAAIAAKTAADAAAKAGRFGTVAIPIVQGLASFIPGIGTATSIASKVVTSYANQPVRSNPYTLPTVNPGGRTMGFADGDSGFFGSFPSFGDIGKVLQGPIGQNIFNLGSSALNSYITAQQGTGRVPITMADTLPAVGRVGAAGRAVATVGRSFFNKFPNLATAIQGYRNMGKNVSRSKLWSLMKRFGPDFLITGGILSAAAVSELAMAGPGRRRMNPGNIKALRRSHRRMKAFHHVCQTNDTLLHARRRRTTRDTGGGTRITQVK